MKQPCNAHAFEQEAKERAANYMRLKAGYKPFYKLNNGNGATLCNDCKIIISEGFTDDLLCEKCTQKQQIVEIMVQDEEDGLY